MTTTMNTVTATSIILIHEDSWLTGGCDSITVTLLGVDWWGIDECLDIQTSPTCTGEPLLPPILPLLRLLLTHRLVPSFVSELQLLLVSLDLLGLLETLDLDLADQALAHLDPKISKQGDNVFALRVPS